MHTIFRILSASVLAGALTSYAAVTVKEAAYGKLPDGRPVKSYTLENSAGVRVVLLDYGATLASVITPDRNGKLADITHGYDTLEGWLSNTSYFGATVGRYANRIAGGKFTLDGKTYTLATNNEPGGIPCHLHGGKEGFDKKLWEGREVERAGKKGVGFTYWSKDGEEGYPGTVCAEVYYLLDDENQLEITFNAATSDKPTVINLTNHTYWNLTGDPKQTILRHQLWIDSTQMLPVNAGLIPTGERVDVSNTPFDFHGAQTIGGRINAANAQLKLGNGYDHCWVLPDVVGLRLVARAVDPKSGRQLELMSDQPGLQFYSGNFLDGTAKGKGGVAYQFRTAFCLEPEKFPDSPNHPAFPSAVLRPGEAYRHTMVYRFSVRRD